MSITTVVEAIYEQYGYNLSNEQVISMLTNEQGQELSHKFEQVKALAVGRETELFAILETCSEEEKVCMQFLYAHMPLSDLANYNGELFLKFVQHALKVRAIVPWGQELDDIMFLNYVLQYRINNENVEYYSQAFFDDIYPRIQGLKQEEAVLAVNYWCYEQATYQSTDIRTASPLTVLKNAYGRCGEESTLGVAALRSVGIPARQVYAPKWSHCDDNHAWVEVWMNGKWSFLGACEPEMRLNTGWFRLPASKGMHIHAKAFSDLVDPSERITTQTSRLTEIGILDHYADTMELKVKVVSPEGAPLEGVHVRFEIVNYAECFPLAILKTNAAGKVQFTTGKGDLIVHAHHDQAYVAAQIDTRIDSELQLVLGDTINEPIEPVDSVLIPPVGGVEEEAPLAEAVAEQQLQRGATAEAKRKAFEATFYDEQRAAAYAQRFGNHSVAIAGLLSQARGNYAELIAFLEDETTQANVELKLALLQTLSKKDLTDVTAVILHDHLAAAMPYQSEYEPDIFTQYVLNPRFAFEMITAYRQPIVEAFTSDQVEQFRANPSLVLDEVQAAIETHDELEYETLSASPAGLLALKKGSLLSKKLLCVSIMRTFGIPARLNTADRVIEAFNKGAWIRLPAAPNEAEQLSATLTLRKRNEVSFDYFRTYTVAVLEAGAYTTLNFEDRVWEGNEITFKLKPGRYRVMTTDRQADGTLNNKFYYVQLAEDEQAELAIELLEGQAAASSVMIEDHSMQSMERQPIQLSELVDVNRNIVAWLNVGAEPTEHLLNEMLESKDKFNTLKPTIVFILKQETDRNNPTLMNVLSEVPHIQLAIQEAEWTLLDPIYEGFTITDKKLPLAVVVEEELTGTFAWAGYNVGIGEMLLKNLQK